MAKIKLVHFEVISLLSESKRVMDFMQKIGKVQLEDADGEDLLKYDTSPIVQQYDRKYSRSLKGIEILQEHCEIKKSFVESFNDFKEIDYSEYKLMCDKVDKTAAVCSEIISLNEEIEKMKEQIAFEKASLDYHSEWLKLDIPMASKRTLTTNIFIGTFNKELSEDEILKRILEIDPELDDVAVEVVNKQKMLTCAVVICHQSHGEKTENALRQSGFVIPDKTSAALPSKTVEQCADKIKSIQQAIEDNKKKIASYSDEYDNLRFLSDFYLAQKEKYEAVEKTASTESAFVVSGYMPERISEEVKFAIEQKFICQMEITEPDYESEDVPVLIENGMFAGGVESITNMYSPPSNKDIDPNPVMAFFYYVFFGFMLSDAGYGILMIIFALVAKAKFKVKDSKLKFANMVFFSGISTVFWGAMFGGWFGDLIPTIATSFLGYDKGPELAIWMDPVSNSMNLLIYCLGFGIIQLFAGLAIRFFMLCKERQFLAAIFDTIPVMVFVVGFAIMGAGLIVEVPAEIKPWGTILLSVGAVLIILTAGRSSKNILGKLGGGLYALYNTATGYLGDILSYSRLLALGLVTGVIANAVNLLATMPGNIVFFVIIFIVGHTINFAINVIGTYVHTNRLQYVEFFSKFYEGSGKVFTPFKINSKYFTIKEEKNYE